MINTKNINTKIFFEEARKELTLTEDRKDLLLEIIDTIYEEYLDREKINLNFICTHNSRRSQLAQVWSFFAIEYFNLKNMFTYSGGTETTSFHRNTVKCLQKTGKRTFGAKKNLANIILLEFFDKNYTFG